MASTAWFRGEGGGLFQFDLPLSELYAKQEAAGRLTRVNADGSAWHAPQPGPVAEDVVEDVPDTFEVDDMDEVAPNLDKPNQGAPKSVWVDWAVLVSDLTADEANAMTKAELIKQYG